MDGPIGITQCAIPSGKRFLYKVPIGDQAGTFWYKLNAELNVSGAVMKADVILLKVSRSLRSASRRRLIRRSLRP